jgi:hypothetical protein
MLPDAPTFDERVCRHAFHLLAESVRVDIHHRVVSFVRRAAQGVRYEDHAEAPIDGAYHGCEHADVGFAAGDYDGVYAGAAQLLVHVPSYRSGRSVA